jgi:hypothetical protein
MGQPTDEELDQMISGRLSSAQPIVAGTPSAVGMEHTKAEPSKGGYYAEQRWNAMNPLQQLGVSYGLGARDIVANTGNMFGAKKLFGIDTTDEGIKAYNEANADENAAIRSSFTGALGDLLGKGITSIPHVLAPEALSGAKIPYVSAALRPLYRTAEGALSPARSIITGGAVQGATMANPNERVSGALTGAGVSALFPVAGYAGKVALRGVNPSEELKWLVDRGVKLTPGQMSPGSWVDHLEQAWGANLPYLGPKIAARREKSYEDFMHAVTADTAPPKLSAYGKQDPLVEGVQPVSRGTTLNDTYTNVDDAFRNAYQQVNGIPMKLKVMNTAGPDVPAYQHALRAIRSKATPAAETERAAVEGTFKDKWSKMIKYQDAKTGEIDSAHLLELRSDLRAQSRKYRATNPDRADLFRESADSITDVLESQLTNSKGRAPAMEWLRAVDKQYAKNSIITDALKSARTGERFTPSQLTAAVRKAQLQHGSARGFARGEGLMRDWSGAADEAFSAHYVPKTGATVMAASAPVAAMAAFPPSAVPIAGLGGLFTTEAGRKLAGGLYPWQASGRSTVSGALNRLKAVNESMLPGNRFQIHPVDRSKDAALNLLRARMMQSAPGAAQNAQWAAEDAVDRVTPTALLDRMSSTGAP